MNKIELDIIALSHSVTQTHSYAVILGEMEGNRRLPIVIGGFEAQAIAVALENMKPSRPLTHDLMKSICDTFEVNLQSIIINNLVDGIFYAQLICENDGKIFEIDSRTSDAIALAVRFGCPIYTYEFILESAGISTEEEFEGEGEASEVSNVSIDESPSEEDMSGLEKYNINELTRMLKSSLDNEEYEKSARIRDEIHKRQSSS
ncbi:MAG: hypothetical protein HKN92_06805 [Chitinophagales bacterium]|nr:hypothetical protein [Chitinophagales bacterium]